MWQNERAKGLHNKVKWLGGSLPPHGICHQDGHLTLINGRICSEEDSPESVDSGQEMQCSLILLSKCMIDVGRCSERPLTHSLTPVFCVCEYVCVYFKVLKNK